MQLGLTAGLYDKQLFQLQLPKPHHKYHMKIMRKGIQDSRA